MARATHLVSVFPQQDVVCNLERKSFQKAKANEALRKANEALRKENAHLQSELLTVRNDLAVASAIAYNHLNLHSDDADDHVARSPPPSLPCSAHAAAMSLPATVLMPKPIRAGSTYH